MNKPIPMTQAELCDTLRDMLERVAATDSFEGSIEYLMPTDEEVPEGTYALVRASYRIGNSMGQGGVRLVGEVTSDEEPFAYGWFVGKTVWHVKAFIVTNKATNKTQAEAYFVADNYTQAARWAPEIVKRGYGSDTDDMKVEIVELSKQQEEMVIPRW